MKVPLWVHEMAAFFWEAADVCEPFPRSLREPILRSPFELSIKELPRLSIATAEHFLGRLGAGWVCGAPNRALRACLAARDGAGLILLDAGDALAERVFSLAHELAHFLSHYWRPRQRAGRHLGADAVEVFDGRRAPTPGERLRALLSNIRLGPHVHLMERSPRRGLIDERIRLIEEEADRLAYELLAPAKAVWSRGQDNQSQANLVKVLQGDFGLPLEQAEAYSRLLLPPSSVDPLIRRFRKSL